MRKTTEVLARECGAFIDVLFAGRHDNRVFTSGELEDFRRLVIENERECAEAVGVTASLPGTNNGYTFVAFNGSDVPVGTKLFTFPPAAQVPEGWKLVPIEPTRGMVMAGYYQELKYAQRVEMYQAMLAAAPEVKKHA